MRIALPILSMLVGLALGGGGMTLYWSGQMKRQFSAQAEWKSLVDKQSSAIQAQRVTINDQSDALQKLTSATDRLIAETRR